MQSGVFERFPDLKFVGYRGAHRLGAVLPRALRRVGAAQPATTGTCRCCRASTSAGTSRSCTSSTRSARTTATTSASPTSCGAPTSRTRRRRGRSTTSSAWRSSSAPAASESEIERIMWKNAADLYKLPYDAAPTTAGVPRRDRRKQHGRQQRIRADLGRLARGRAARRLRGAAPGEPARPGAEARDARRRQRLVVDGASRCRCRRPRDRLGLAPRRRRSARRRAGRRGTTVLPALYDPAERIKAQWADSVDAEVLYPYAGPVGRDQAARRRRAQARAGARRTTTGSPSSARTTRTACSAWRSCRPPACDDAQDELLRCVERARPARRGPRRVAERRADRREPGRRAVLGGRQRSPGPDQPPLRRRRRRADRRRRRASRPG